MTTAYPALLGFDLETTGVDVETDRIVTAALVEVEDWGPVRRRSWLVDPGIPIPDGAAGVHGVTTEIARRDGMNSADAVAQIADEIATALDSGQPLVIMNAPYDLTLLDRECRRHGYTPVTEWLNWPNTPVVLDPLVLDKHIDPYRPGPRKLESLAAWYEVVLEDAHEASADALAAVQVALRILHGAPDPTAYGRRTTYRGHVVGRDLAELHANQPQWHAAWAANYQQYLRRRNPTAVIDGSWPIRPLPTMNVAARAA
ncbi:exonuclease domain-containing protein [Streptomyces sp. BH105]|uniref:exonuclease domain-containing protein n=1 Tax=Streptomyces sp. BH105 TaxID=3410408 RepID=UPI003CE70891